MNLGEKLQLLRNNNRLSQEELGEKLGVSRQAISKWESGQSTPDLKKLIAISELYNITIDSLVKNEYEFDVFKSNEVSSVDNQEEKKEDNKNGQIVININKDSIFTSHSVEYEYKSKKSIFGVPLVHVNLGKGFKKAKGIIAVGNISCGIISSGFVSLGVLSCGFLSIGGISLGLISIAILLAIGVFSLGSFSIGAISVGIFSFGAVSIGKYAFGACAIASDIAIGDYARANVAIGNTVEGINNLPLDTPLKEVKDLLKKEYPNLNQWIINVIDFCMKSLKIGTR
ncbi:MAG: helix-turn-helix transcriptional regulator [Clostridium sp.]|nr:helix-turn-helix transcriptional regulator [Clostridium sp.]